MLGHKRVPSREGGVEVVVGELSSRMARRGHQVTCYNRGYSQGTVQGTDLKDPDRDGKSFHSVRLKNVPTINIKGAAAVTAAFFGTIAATVGNYDIIHIHAEGSALFCRIPKLFGKRVIVTIHGLDHQRAKWGRLASSVILLGEKAAAAYADEIIVLSKSAKQYFLDRYGRKTVFIPNGVNEPVMRPAKKITELWGLEKDNYILFLGRLVPEKGLRCLIEAWKQTMTDKKLIIAGSASDTERFEKELRQLSEKDNRVLFTGFVEGEILEELYSNAYLFTLPSDLEGMPLTILEAMSYGNCCLVSDIPECAEIVGDHAMTFSRGNVEELRKCLQMLCDRPEIRDAYKTGASDYILGRHRWETTVERTLDLYWGQGTESDQ